VQRIVTFTKIAKLSDYIEIAIKPNNQANHNNRDNPKNLRIANSSNSCKWQRPNHPLYENQQHQIRANY